MSEETPRRTIEIRPQPPSLQRALSSALLTCLILLVLLVTYLAGDVERTGTSIVWVLVLGVPLLLLLGGLLFRYERQKRPPGVLTLTGDAVLWQQPPPGKDVVIPYEEIRSVHEREGLVVLGQEAGQGLVLPESWFPEPGLAGSVAADLRARIGGLPDGEAILARIGENRERGESIASRGRGAAISVSAVLAGIFLLQMLLDASADPFRLLAFGANSSVFVRDGEWFRLATGNLLHAGLFHLAVNLFSLVALGRILEPLLGKARFLVIFLGSALAGAAGSALVGNHLLSVGASTGIAGLIGALGIAEQRWPDFFGRRPSWKIWLSLVFWLLLPGFIFPNVDNHAHVAGFLAGAVLTLASTHTRDPLALARRHPLLWNLLAALLVGLFALAGAVVVRHWGEPGRDLETAVRLLEASEVPPELVNEAAWLLATSPDAGRPRLEKALAAMERLLAEKPAAQAEYLDTQATLHYRLGSLAEAVFTEREALRRADTPFHASQLARFEWEYGNFQGGPFRPGAPLPVLTVLPDGALSVDLRGNRLPDRTLLRFVLGNGDGAFASVGVVLGIEDTGNTLRSQPGKLSGAPADLRAVLIFVNVRGDGRGRTQKTRWTVQEVVPEVRELP
ncbi:MAG TPA: rhomboid family intramembrane serine protease [Thermoanaerobaculia bacterium]|nr:rhomboid family intramembrane serine protease [Thermoanaerobaculia bacterium]